MNGQLMERCVADIRVRDVDEQVVAMLKAQARRHGNSLSEEVRTLLATAALGPRREFVAQLRHQLAALRATHGDMPDSTPGIRAWRDGGE